MPHTYTQQTALSDLGVEYDVIAREIRALEQRVADLDARAVALVPDTATVEARMPWSPEPTTWDVGTSIRSGTVPRADDCADRCSMLLAYASGRTYNRRNG